MRPGLTLEVCPGTNSHKRPCIHPGRTPHAHVPARPGIHTPTSAGRPRRWVRATCAGAAAPPPAPACYCPGHAPAAARLRLSGRRWIATPPLGPCCLARPHPSASRGHHHRSAWPVRQRPRLPGPQQRRRAHPPATARSACMCDDGCDVPFACGSHSTKHVLACLHEADWGRNV